MSQEEDLLTCSLHGQSLGIPVRHVREVVTPVRYTPIPKANDIVVGLINLRGHVITQLDMRKALGLPPRGKDEPFRIVIIETDSHEAFGLVVDRVGEVMRSETKTMEDLPKSLAPCWRQVGDSVLKLNDRLLVILNVERFIQHTLELAEQLQAQAGAQKTKAIAAEAAA